VTAIIEEGKDQNHNDLEVGKLYDCLNLIFTNPSKPKNHGPDLANGICKIQNLIIYPKILSYEGNHSFSMKVFLFRNFRQGFLFV
jgi:hypothetical protein